MSGVALGIGVGTAAIGGISSYMGSQKMAKAQKEAMEAQIAAENRAQIAYQQAVAKAEPLYKPYQEAGGQAFGTMADLMRPGGYLYKSPDMNDFRNDPQYHMLMNSMNDSAGGPYSGQTAIDLQRKRGEFADRAYGEIYNRRVGEQERLRSGLGGMADTGKWATGSLASLYTNTGNKMADIYGRMGETRAQGIRGMGEAQASGIMGMGSALSSGIGLGMNVYNANKNRQQYDDMMRRLTPPTPSNYGPPPSPSGGYGYMNPGTLPNPDFGRYGGNW